MQRLDVEFRGDGGGVLRGWLFVPDTGAGRRPAVTMAHGFAAIRQHGLEPFARAFAAAGFVVLLHDHRGFGASDGPVRQDVDPWQQIADWRYAVSFLEGRPEVDPDRVGLWGSSYAGAHAIVLGATERRLRAVVAQVPLVSGFDLSRRRVLPEVVPTLEALFAEDERARARGEAPARGPLASDDPKDLAFYRTPEEIAFFTQPLGEGRWENDVTVRSVRAAMTYEPGPFLPRVSPTPLLMIVATSDTMTITDLELAAYERALEPKRLVTVPGGHFDPYSAQFGASSGAAVDWFRTHL